MQRHHNVAIILKSMAQIHHAELYNQAHRVGRAARGDTSPESRQLSTRLAICTMRSMTFITTNKVWRSKASCLTDFTQTSRARSTTCTVKNSKTHSEDAAAIQKITLPSLCLALPRSTTRTATTHRRARLSCKIPKRKKVFDYRDA
jgi:hypothetical protein